MRRFMEQVGLPLAVVLLGYGRLALGPGAVDSRGPLRLVLHLVVVMLMGRLGLRLGLNRTASLLAGLFYAAGPLAAYSLVPGAPLLPLLWTVLVLAAATWWLSFHRSGPVGLMVAAAVLLAGTTGIILQAGNGLTSGFAWSEVPRDLLVYGARFVLPAPLVGDPRMAPVVVFMLGALVWGFWALLAVHRALLDNPLPRNLLLLTWAALLPVLGRAAEPALFLLPLVMFSFFLMGFLRPSKLIDSPRILLMAAFFLTLLAATTTTCLS